MNDENHSSKNVLRDLSLQVFSSRKQPTIHWKNTGTTFGIVGLSFTITQGGDTGDNGLKIGIYADHDYSVIFYQLIKHIVTQYESKLHQFFT